MSIQSSKKVGRPTSRTLASATHLHALLLIVLLCSNTALGDAIIVSRAMSSTSIMEVFIEESVVRVEIEVGMTDLPAFINLLPDEVYERLNLPPNSSDERLIQFFKQDLVLTADSNKLVGRLKSAQPRARIVRDEISGEPISVSKEDIERVFFFVLEYPIEGKPKSLAFKVPDIQSPGAIASIGFVVYHLGVAANDFRYLMTGATIDLNWEDPWHSRFRLRQLRRAYDAPMNVFLYVEPYEVRVEIIVRPIDIQQWIDLDLQDRGTIKPQMYGSIQGRVADFLAKHLNLTIDGEPAVPVLDRINFLRRTLSSSTVIDPPEELSVFSAQLGAIFIVPRNGLPQEASVEWELFSEKIPAIPSAATDEAGPMPATLTPDDNILMWKNFLLNPTIPTMVGVENPPRAYARPLYFAAWCSVALLVALLTFTGLRYMRTRAIPRAHISIAALLIVASGLSFYGSRQVGVDEERSGRIVASLLHNVYRSFDYREEGAVYDALALSITGELLTQTYLETKRSLELRNQGGARVKVNEVDIIECSPKPLNDGIGFIAHCRWNVTGSVGHWGHIHQRRNQYSAVVTIRAIDGVWKIIGLELISEERI